MKRRDSTHNAFIANFICFKSRRCCVICKWGYCCGTYGNLIPQRWMKICLYFSCFAHSKCWLGGGPDFASVSASCSLYLYSSSPPILLHALPATPIWPVCVWNVHILTSLLRPGLAIPPLWSSLLSRFIMILCYAAVVYDQRSCTSLRVIRLPSPVEGVCPLTLCSGLRLQPQIMGHCVRLQEVEYPQGCSLYHAERQP